MVGVRGLILGIGVIGGVVFTGVGDSCLGGEVGVGDSGAGVELVGKFLLTFDSGAGGVYVFVAGGKGLVV